MLHRHLSRQLKNRWRTARSVYIFGPRQSGKTTLAKMTFPELLYISLEDPDNLEYITNDPRGFLRQFTSGGIIDEPQRSPELFSYLQGQIDNEKKKFILTSSQNFLAMESISQSLAGRITILNLFPLTRQEIEQKPDTMITDLFTVKSKIAENIDFLWPYILRGGYPEVNVMPEALEYWHSDYVKTYLERDVRRVINVHDLSTFQRFIKLCAARTGNILNKASLASDCGISESNCTRWLSLLEQSGIIFLLKPFYNNFNKRQMKSPKLFFVDTGLCCHLLGIKTTTHLNPHPLSGAILETYVISELYKKFLNNGLVPEFYYWRDQHGHEVDLLIEMPTGEILPIEIKSGQTITSRFLDSIHKWCNLAQIDRGILLYGGCEFQARTDVDVIPISEII